MIKIDNLNPDYSKLIKEGTFGDIYRCKEDNNIIVKLTKNFNKKYNGECNKKIIDTVKNHKNLMTIIGHDKKKFKDIFFIYLENINGITLHEFYYSYHFSNFIIKNTLKQILSGLSYLHQHLITHRDITLENILINPNTFEIKIIDFGLSCYGYPCKDIVGTTGFFAPEMLYSKNNYDSKCDIWSTGCIFYFIVTGEHPFYFPYDRTKYIEQLKNETKIIFYQNKWTNNLFLYICQNMLLYDFKKRFSAKQCLQLLIN